MSSEPFRKGTDIKKAAALLLEEKLVALPTETVYGLGALASSRVALSNLYRAKGRPASHPVIVHLWSKEQIEDWAVLDPRSSTLVEKIAYKFWPGPLTLILNRQPNVLDQVTGGQDTVAIRIPDHPLTLKLLQEVNRGVSAPSANKFGRLSPTRAEDVDNEFGDEVSYILDGGPCPVGIESTILDLTASTPRILRPGRITQKEISESIDITVYSKFEENSVQSSDDESVRVPGALKQHYAPQKPVFIIEKKNLVATINKMNSENKSPAVLAFSEKQDDLDAPWIVSSLDPQEYAQHLYSRLRTLDSSQCDCILVESVPSIPNWSAIKDRLNRAASLEE